MNFNLKRKLVRKLSSSYFRAIIGFICVSLESYSQFQIPSIYNLKKKNTYSLHHYLVF